jgi:DNA-directed RNA polymerase specialized sigma24 family protein
MSSGDLSQELIRHLPYLRRYARALTGSQRTGDNYAMATMEALIAAPDEVEAASVRIDLFRSFHKIWITSGQPIDTPSADPDSRIRESRAQDRISSLMPNTREALLLHTVEGFSISEIATIMDCPSSEAEDLVQHALKDLRDMVAGEVMIIEDEAVIAMDLEAIVSSMGHSVTGVARTEAGALDLGDRRVPDLILADIQLADGSSGIDAVNELLSRHGDRPVIFITAFPERLLTGDRPEPAFLITKPYSEDQVRAAVSQAMFFTTTEEMSV